MRATSSLRTADGRGSSALVLALLTLAFAGCGGGEEDVTVTAPAPTVASTTTAPAPPAPPPPQAPEPAERTIPVGDGRGGVALEEIGSFSAPVYVTQPPGEAKDLYVVEQGGTIQRVSPDGAAETFLDISDEVTAGGEQGLLSVAFSPGYERDGLLYVDYTDTAGDSRIAEYEAVDGAVDEGSRRELLRIDDPYPNHNGGLLLFGPDEKLYIGLGDGGAGADPDRTALDLSSLFGKIMRIDPRPDGDLPYTVPADNPFVDEGDVRGEVYSYGLRNPWRFSFDRMTGDLTIGDVGQDAEEEINIVAEGDGSGASFGWSAFEGNQPFNDDQESPDAVAPTLVATHDDGNCSVTGGVVVRDPALRTLFGRYLWGDFCVGELQSFSSEPGEEARDNRPLGLSVESLSSFGEDNAGHVYALSLSGPVYRLVPAR